MYRIKLQQREIIGPFILVSLVIILSIFPYILHIDLYSFEYYLGVSLVILSTIIYIIINIYLNHKTAVSDIYIDTNSITIIYKRFNKTTNRICIAKEDITSFHIDVNISIINTYQNPPYHHYDFKILMKTNNDKYSIIPLTIKNELYPLRLKKLIMKFLKYSNYIPNFSCKITSYDYLLIEEIKQYYQTGKKLAWYKRKGEFLPYKIIFKQNTFEC